MDKNSSIQFNSIHTNPGVATPILAVTSGLFLFSGVSVLWPRPNARIKRLAGFNSKMVNPAMTTIQWVSGKRGNGKQRKRVVVRMGAPTGLEARERVRIHLAFTDSRRVQRISS